MRPRPIDLCAIIGALGGVALAIDGWRAGSLFRYQLAAFVAGASFALPLVSIALLREPARRFWRRVAFACVPLAALLLLAELGIRVFGPAEVPPEVLREDPRLGHVLVPGSGGMDGQGFRNAAVPEAVDVLCVGDSQTWGFHVDADDTFPVVLGRELGLSAYQMANGAYGPVQYRELVRQGLRLHPRLVIVGLYFGNDLIDAVQFAGLSSGDDLRAPGRTYSKPRNPELDGLSSPNWTMAFVDGVIAHSRVLGMAAAVVKSRLPGGVLDQQPGAVSFADAAVGTILLPDYRLPTVDPDREAVRDGLRITAQCVRDITAVCRDAGSRCMLLAIPSKEYCYAEWQRGLDRPLPALAALHAAESRTRADVFTAARAAGCEVVDLAPACVTALREGRPPWAGNGDGHLMRNGHAEAARMLAQQWRSR